MALARNQRLQKLVGGGWLERTSLNWISRVQLRILGAHKDKEVVRAIKQMRRRRRCLLSAYECYIVYSLALSQSKHPGDIAEVGTYEGGSARLICEAKGDRTFYVFDTFEGLPEAAEADGKVHRVSQYKVSLESVQEYLKDFPNVHLYKGLFPETSGPIEDKTFSFAHFDVDLYESTRACLEFFYPRMIVGGIMLSHDYSILAGVRQAFGEFLEDKPEVLIELPSTQCMVIKLPGPQA